MSFHVNIAFIVKILSFFLFYGILHGQSTSGHYMFTIEEAPYTRLCSTKKILTVNGQFPGPTIYAQKGDIIYVKVHNKGNYNITLHWHGVKQPRNPWSDGPEYITQCAIKPGGVFKYKLILSEEEGTIWWHAHSLWSRATVHGALIVYPKNGTRYPFPKPHAEIPIILGEWWKKDVEEVRRLMVKTGGDPNTSDAYTINETFRLAVDHGKTYLLRIVNAIMNEILFFGIANHQLTVVGLDGSYNNPVTSKYIAISPGQTTDVLLHANQRPDHYYMVGRAYASDTDVPFDNTTTTAILQYNGKYTKSPKPHFPYLPYYNDTTSFLAFLGLLRSKIDPKHAIGVPKTITTRLISTVSINLLPCPDTNTLCEAPNGSRFAASLTNISYQATSIDILQAYYKNIKGVFGTRFPSRPPLVFNYTAEVLPLDLLVPKLATEVRVLDYNSKVEIVFQGTNLVAGIDHPMHLHGFNFYVVGVGLGNFDIKKDPLRYNLVDPPLRNTACVPKNGWLAIRFTADNPGVWFMHCHLERHLSWGMEGVFIVKDGKTSESKMLPPPSYMPPC